MRIKEINRFIRNVSILNKQFLRQNCGNTNNNRKMNDFNDAKKGDIKEHNPNWPHPGHSRSCKTNYII